MVDPLVKGRCEPQRVASTHSLNALSHPGEAPSHLLHVRALISVGHGVFLADAEMAGLAQPLDSHRKMM